MMLRCRQCCAFLSCIPGRWEFTGATLTQIQKKIKTSQKLVESVCIFCFSKYVYIRQKELGIAVVELDMEPVMVTKADTVVFFFFCCREKGEIVRCSGLSAPLLCSNDRNQP